MTYLLLTVRFLDDRYHGLLDRGGPRNGRRRRFGCFRRWSRAWHDGVNWSSEKTCPRTRTSHPPAERSTGCRGTRVASADHHRAEIQARTGDHAVRTKQRRRQETLIGKERLTGKPTIPTLFILEEDQKPEVHYRLGHRRREGLSASRHRTGRSFADHTRLGHRHGGRRLRTATEKQLQQLKGVSWCPKTDASRGEGMLRTPTYDDEAGECTLSDLRHCHETFMNRIEHGKPIRTVD